MSKKKRTLLVSFSIIVLCICAMVGMTYALFTDSALVKNHLAAGNLDVELTRTNLEYRVLDENGYLETIVVEDDINFTSSNKENIFGIDATGMVIAPGSYFDAELKLSNNGNVTFTYSVAIKLSSEANKLAEQLQVTITHANGKTTTKKLSELSSSLTMEAGTMAAKDTSKVFNVKVEFIDSTSNNLAQNQKVVFDIVVNATQATK